MFIRIFSSLLFYFVTANVFASTLSVEHFKSIGNDIYRNPHPIYLQLLDIEQSQTQLSEEAQLWLLYRRAQAENLLYFYDEFEQTVQKATTLFNDKTSPEILSSFSIYQGIFEQRNGQYSQSDKYFVKAMEIAHEHDLNQIYILAKQELAYNRSLNGLYETSLADLQEAYVEAFAADDHFLIAVINEVYGAIFGYMEEYEKSIEYYTRALDTYEGLGYRPYVAEAIYGLASTYRYWKKYDKAIEKFALYRQKIDFTPNKEISFFGAYGLGMTYAEKGECEQALKVIDDALSLGGIIDYDAELYKRKSECNIKLGNLEQAQEDITKADDIFISMPELAKTKWALETIKVKAKLAFAQGDFEQSYLLATSYYQQYHAIVKNNANLQLIKVRAAMEMNRQNIELSLLQEQNNVQKLQIQQQEQRSRQQYYLIAAGAVVLLMILFMLIMQYRNHQKVFALSIKDSLSGLFNRRYIFDYLDRIVANTAERQGELTILLFDIDDFKMINDQYGHPLGDEVIGRVADISQSTLRTGDVIGRIGGEEFLCILPRADIKQAEQIAQRLKENISNAIFTNESDEQIKVSISVGISVYSDKAPDRASLYVQSDKALYQAKKQGKNQVVIYQQVD